MFKAIEYIKTIKTPNIVVLTGAGISAESGIKTFRDSNGLWEEHAIEDVATPEGFARDPHLVHRFYNARRRQLMSDNVKPNEAHKALAKLEKRLVGNVTIVTQNIDNLHEQAGSEQVIHMHGEILSAKCVNSDLAVRIQTDLSIDTRCECCTPSSAMRPDIVWFGEMPYQMDAIHQHLSNADLFISIGTSGNVYPAAGFVQIANSQGAFSLELNLEPSEGYSEFAECKFGPASVLVPTFIDELLTVVQS